MSNDSDGNGKRRAGKPSAVVSSGVIVLLEIFDRRVFVMAAGGAFNRSTMGPGLIAGWGYFAGNEAIPLRRPRFLWGLRQWRCFNCSTRSEDVDGAGTLGGCLVPWSLWLEVFVELALMVVLLGLK